MTNLQEAVEIYLASLPDEEWRALVYRVRPPDEPEATPRIEHATLHRER